MKNLLDMIKREWEWAVLCGVVLAILLVVMFSWLNREDEGFEGGLLRTKGIPERSICPADLAFLQPAEHDDLSRLGSSWGLPAYMLKERTVKKPRPVKPKPVVKEAPKPVPVAVRLPKAAPIGKKIVPKPIPKKLEHVGTLYFAEVQELADGTRVALFELSTGDERRTVALGRGETRLGLTVTGLSSRSVQVRDVRGKEISLRQDRDGQVWFYVE